VVHVRDSSLGDREFSQERPIGPPDREAEKARAEEAEARRAELGDDRSPVYDPAFVPGGADDEATPAMIGDSPSGRIEPREGPAFGNLGGHTREG